MVEERHTLSIYFSLSLTSLIPFTCICHQSTFGSELIYGRGEERDIEDIFDDMQDIVEKHGSY